MQGVVTIHQESETQSKPSYFCGQCWGALGIVVGSFVASFCPPLGLRIHQGWQPLGHEDDKPSGSETLAYHLVLMALDCVLDQDQPSVLVLDAFLSVASVFALANSVWLVKLKAPYLMLIIRAKKELCRLFATRSLSLRSARLSAELGRQCEIDGVLRSPSSVFNRLVPGIWSGRKGLDSRPQSDLETERWLDPLCLRPNQSRLVRVNVQRLTSGFRRRCGALLCSHLD